VAARELFLKRLELQPANVADGDRELAYPFTIPAIRNLDTRELTSPVTVFVGENGSGKSTLLEAIAVVLGMNAAGGSRNLRSAFTTASSSLHERLLLTRSKRRIPDSWFLRAESFYNVATAVDEIAGTGGYGGRSLHAQSHGESFWSLFMHRFGVGVYLLDEPEAALSPQRQMAFLVRMHELVQQGAQFVLASHAPMLMAYPGAVVWEFGDDGIAEVDPRATAHWQTLRRFFADTDGVLRQLLAE
jgi:predicted ATPase